MFEKFWNKVNRCTKILSNIPVLLRHACLSIKNLIIIIIIITTVIIMTIITSQDSTNYVNGSRLAEQGPSSGKCSRQGNIGHHHANPAIIKKRKWTSQENKIFMESYLLSEPKIRGCRKHMLSLWPQKGMFWVSEQILVDQTNTIRRNS